MERLREAPFQGGPGVQCPRCRHANPAGVKFCGECGAPLTGAAPPHPAVALPAAVPTAPQTPAAPQVLTTLESKYATPQTYTPKHLAEKILTTKNAIEGERKGVTVMFADVSGFTAMSERLDPEDVHSTMDRAFEVILREVHRYEGTINLATRLLGLAKPGQIVVSRRTQHLREQFFTFEELGEFQVKGKTDPVRAYALVGEIRGRTRLEVSKERGLTPLFGRERELGRLTDAYRRAVGGEGATVLLAGEPGVGKSRLLYEFLQTLEGLGLLELDATCVSYGRAKRDRKSTRLNSSHLVISYAVFCL